VLRKKLLISAMGVVIMASLVGTSMAMDGRSPFELIWEAIYDLQARVTSLEQSIDGKTWHFVTSFTLSQELTISSQFFVQGEKWRFRWEPEGATWKTAYVRFIIFDENGYVIDLFEVWLLLYYGRMDARGIYYMAHGEGSYYIEVLSIGENRVNFTIESYH